MISELIDKVVLEIINNDYESLIFKCHDGSEYTMHHHQSCCESVYLEDINGDFSDLIGSKILQAEESSSDATGHNDHCESATWTFYKLATIKGYVTLRWLGESNGYYSEGVDFEISKEPNIKELRKNKLNKIEKKLNVRW